MTEHNATQGMNKVEPAVLSAGDLTRKIWQDFAMSDFNGSISDLFKLIEQYAAGITIRAQRDAQMALECLRDDIDQLQRENTTLRAPTAAPMQGWQDNRIAELEFAMRNALDAIQRYPEHPMTASEVRFRQLLSPYYPPPAAQPGKGEA